MISPFGWLWGEKEIKTIMENRTMTRINRVNREDFEFLRRAKNLHPTVTCIEINGFLFMAEEGEKKMTREEAIIKVWKICYPESYPHSMQDRKWAEKQVKVLEALGLLKFEEKNSENEWEKANKGPVEPYKTEGNFVPMVMRAGLAGKPTYIVEKEIYELWKGPIEALIKAGYSIKKEF